MCKYLHTVDKRNLTNSYPSLMGSLTPELNGDNEVSRVAGIPVEFIGESTYCDCIYTQSTMPKLTMHATEGALLNAVEVPYPPKDHYQPLSVSGANPGMRSVLAVGHRDGTPAAIHRLDQYGL